MIVDHVTSRRGEFTEERVGGSDRLLGDATPAEARASSFSC